MFAEYALIFLLATQRPNVTRPAVVARDANAQQLQVPEQTVTVILLDRSVTMTVTDAEKRLAQALKENDSALAAALAFALGTAPVPARCITWEQHIAEVTSWWAAPKRRNVTLRECVESRR